MKSKLLKAFLIMFVLLITAGISSAGVDVNLNIGLPVYTFAEEPELVVIPNTYVYFAPGVDLDIVFYHGYWYRPYNGIWYRANNYNGPWHNIKRHRVPRYIIDLPPDYRHLYRDNPRIPHRHVHDNWNRWEKEKYWNKRQWKHEASEWRHDRREQRHERQEHRRDVRQDRREDRREHRQDVREKRQEHRQDMRQDRQEKRKDARQDKREKHKEKREDRDGREKKHD